MQELDDNALLREYAGRDSEEAFATLVTRHVNKVYSVALRHTGNPHQAEEITQAVFVTLARKAGSLDKRVILEGWLYQTARLTSLSFIRSEIRRSHREQEAYVQTTANENDSEVWKQIAPLIDTAMAGLNETDRHAVVLRFFYGKSMKEIGDAVGGNEGAARTRLHRAVEKLRKFFFKHGVTSTTETISRVISNHSVQVAPEALAKTITAAALAAKSAVVGGSTFTLVKATLIAMKTKTVIITFAAAVLAIGGGAYLISQVKIHRPAAPAAALVAAVTPVQFANTEFSPNRNRDANFIIDVDPETRRTSNSAPAIRITGPITTAADPAPTNGATQKLDNSSSIFFYITNGSTLMGKHIRISGWLKSSEVQFWASAFLYIWDKDNHMRAIDNMKNRPIRGTTDWQQIEFVTDVPNEACCIRFGPDLYGTGTLWGDDFKLELAPPDEPVTDDRSWHAWYPDSFNYSETPDFDNMHEGHPTICLAYTPDSAAPAGSFMWWGQSIRDADNYKGHTVRMTGMVRTENVSGSLQPTLKVRANNYKIIAKDHLVKGSNLKGTSDWTKFTVTAAIPKTTDHFDAGFCLWGSGKAWVDMNTIKIEITK